MKMIPPFWVDDNREYQRIEPTVELKSKHVFFVLSYFFLSSLILLVTQLIKCHVMFNVLHVFGTGITCMMIWSTLGKMAYHQTRVQQNPEI